MADTTEAGTPQAPVAAGGNPGTTAAPADGGLMAGLTPDQKALFLAQEKKAEEGNRALAQAREMEARAAEMVAQSRVQPQADPMAELVRGLQERARYGDADAATQLSLLTMTTMQQADTELTNEMVKHQIPAARWDTVRGLVRQSNYRMSVVTADQLARGSEVPDLANQLKAKDERIAALEKAVNARTVLPGSTSSPATTTPAAVAAEGSMEPVTLEEYEKLPQHLRDKASIRR